MAWGNGNQQSAGKNLPAFGVTDWQLFVFRQTMIKDANTGADKFVKLECKMSSKPAEGDKYGAGVIMTVMLSVSGNRETKCEPGDYTHKWIRVTGRISASDNTDRNGNKYTNLTVWADEMHEAPAK